jgi:hypothetical protein
MDEFSKSPVISVVIPAHNGRDLLTACLDSVFRSDHDDFEVIVVDNGSTDGTEELLRDRFPQVRRIIHKEPLGFAKAANIGIKQARGEFIALLNQDAEVDSRWLSVLKNTMEKDSTLGICASKMYNYYRRELLDGAGDTYVRSGDAFRLGHGLPDGERFNQSHSVFGACGGAAFYRRSMLEEIGPLDEDFFMYYEDVDLNFRAQLYGYHCRFIPEAVIYHVGSASSGGVQTARTTFLIARNSIFVILKNYPTSLLIANLRHIVRSRVAFIRHYCNQDREMGRAFIKGLAFALLKLPAMLVKRYRIQKHRKIPLDDLQNLFLLSEQQMQVHG